MPRLTRKNIKVFAGNATNNGVFGSLQANNPTTTSDIEQIQSLNAWGEGWNAATETSEELPPLEEIQSVSYVTTYQQAYIMQEGIPEWAATVTYYKGCLTKEVTSTGFKIYNSLTDNNTGNLLSDTSNWKKVMDSADLYAFDNTVVHKTGNETVAGVKTFSSSPVVPTATSGDSSTKAASTAFVTGAINTINNAVVHLAGAETITGEKTFDSNVVLKNSTSSTTAPSADTDRYLNFYDSNNILNGAVQTKIHTDLTIEAVLFASSMTTGTRRDSALRCVVPASGDGYVVAPASDVSNSILTTVAKSKGNNGHFKLGNGMIVQYGRSSTRTITYPIPFSTDTSFSIVVNNQAGTDGYGRPDAVENLTKTSCMVSSLAGYPVRWIAVGY